MKHTDLPALYQSADKLSLDSQKTFYCVLFLHLFFLVIASIISVINSTLVIFPIAQALVFLGALICAIYLYLAKPERYWYGGRAVAESIKTITWRYISRSEPFNVENNLAKSTFNQTIRSIIEQNKDVAQKQITDLSGVQISEEMSRLRNLDVNERRVNYLENRIKEQLTWYAKKASDNKNTVNKYFISLIIVNFLAFAFAIAKVKFTDVSYWPTDALVVIAASFLAWIQAKKFQELSASYALAAHEISLIREQASHEMSDEELSQFVGDSENAFSREHTQWVARKDS